MTAREQGYAAPWSRVLILLIGLTTAAFLAWRLTGSIVPTDSRANLLFQSGLLLLVLGSSIVEHKFTRPADAVVNGLMGIVTLIPIYRLAPRVAWNLVFGFSVAVFIAAVVCVALSDRPGNTGWRSQVTNSTYRFVSTFGQARFFFSVIIWFGVVAFFDIRSTATVVLLCFWVFYIWAWSIGLPTLLTKLIVSPAPIQVAASVLRVDTPNIVRAELLTESEWSRSRPKACCQADGKVGLLLPLYSEVQSEKRVGTALFMPYDWPSSISLSPGQIVDPPDSLLPSESDLSRALGGDDVCPMIGFVVEGSEISSIKFEIWDSMSCEEGQLVWSKIGKDRVYYQIVAGETREEAFEANRHGFQVAVAAQVGSFVEGVGFQKFAWLPAMNSPVFVVPADWGSHLSAAKATDFRLGTIPKSAIPVSIMAAEAFDHHIAILGVTGSGKTELALDLIRYAVNDGSKVIVVDLTARYSGKLADLTPRNLSLSSTLAEELSAKLFAVETGQYGAGKEKTALKDFNDKLTTDITASVKSFLEDKTTATRVGLITLPEISNTRATLHITELYLTITLNYAKGQAATSPRTLIVLEEAHTVIPEASTMGVGDYDSKAIVGKMTQIALQGRKYRVGLLVIAQRTATVSKSVLTQCNTIISFSCFDDTSIHFLSNMFGADFAALLPSLPRLQAVVYGRALRSERPIIVQIPFNQAKAGVN
jgi:uncharacterized protein